MTSRQRFAEWACCNIAANLQHTLQTLWHGPLNIPCFTQPSQSCELYFKMPQRLTRYFNTGCICGLQNSRRAGPSSMFSAILLIKHCSGKNDVFSALEVCHWRSQWKGRYLALYKLRSATQAIIIVYVILVLNLFFFCCAFYWCRSS